MFFKRNKYNSKRTVYNGIVYDSIKEANYASTLDLLKRAKEIKSWTGQHKLKLEVNNFHICNCIVDFLVVMPDDTLELHEVKGFETAAWKIKWKLAQALYGKKYKFVLIK